MLWCGAVGGYTANRDIDTKPECALRMQNMVQAEKYSAKSTRNIRNARESHNILPYPTVTMRACPNDMFWGNPSRHSCAADSRATQAITRYLQDTVASTCRTADDCNAITISCEVE